MLGLWENNSSTGLREERAGKKFSLATKPNWVLGKSTSLEGRNGKKQGWTNSWLANLQQQFRFWEKEIRVRIVYEIWGFSRTLRTAQCD